MFRSSCFPWLLQAFFVIAAVAMIYGGWGITTDNRAVLMELRNTNLSNLLVWSYWWPLLILVTIFFGRFWCTVCPVEFVSRIFSKIGLKKEAPRLFKTLWLIPILYAFISIIAVRYWDIHRLPHYMAWYLIIAFTASAIIGFLFKERTFCKYICPISLLLAFYSLMSRWGIHVTHKPTCASCKDKACMNPKLPKSFLASPCLSQVNIPDCNHDKRKCQLCMHCVKLCPHANVSYSPGTRSYYLLDTLKMRSAEYAMALIVIAYSLHEAIHKLPGTGDFLKNFANFFKMLVPGTMIPGKIMDGLSLFIIFPCICIGLFALLNALISKVDFKTSFKYGVAFLLPLGVLGELTKGLNKMMTRLPYVPYSLSDPAGIESAEAIAAKEIVVNKIPYGSEFICVVWTALFILGITVVLKKIMNEKDLQKSSQVLYAVLTILYAIFCGFYPAVMKIL